MTWKPKTDGMADNRFTCQKGTRLKKLEKPFNNAEEGVMEWLKQWALVHAHHVRSDSKRDLITAKAKQMNCSSQMLYMWIHNFYKYYMKLHKEKVEIAEYFITQ